MSGLESVDETEVFSGSGNSLVMNQTYTHTFQCNYQLSRYPFDTQVNIVIKHCNSLKTSFSDLLHRHGHGKFGHYHSYSDPRPDDHDPKSRYAHLSGH